MTFYKEVRGNCLFVIVYLLIIVSWFYNTTRIKVRETHIVFIQYHGREDGADLSTLTDRERERQRERGTMRGGAGMWGNILKD
jgi:hypothetical protein